jgi:hypothetical protein
MTRIAALITTLGLAACTAPAKPGGLSTITYKAPSRGEPDASLLGLARMGDCSPKPLHIGPEWSDEEAAALREASEDWSDAIGVDLGSLPVDETCGWRPADPQVTGCVLRADRAYTADVSTDTIRVYVESLADHVAVKGRDWLAAVRVTAAHEMGHWIGLPHSRVGIMTPWLAPDDKRVTWADVLLYEETCLGGI